MGVSVGVSVGVKVGVGVGVSVGVSVTPTVGVRVAVTMGVRVAVEVITFVGVAVGGWRMIFNPAWTSSLVPMRTRLGIARRMATHWIIGKSFFATGDGDGLGGGARGGDLRGVPPAGVLGESSSFRSRSSSLATYSWSSRNGSF